MAIIKRWIEVDDNCFGPDKKNHHWEMFLIICRCTLIKRKRLGDFVRRKRDVISLVAKTKKAVREKLEQFIQKKDVQLLE